MPATKLRPPQVEITIAWSTLFKFLAFAALIVVLAKLWPLIGMLMLSLFLAITMAPVAKAVRRWGGPKWLAILVCALLLLGSVGGFLFFVTPLVGRQISEVIQALPSFKEHALQHLPSSGPFRGMVENLLQSPAFSDPAPLMKHFVDWGAAALESMIQFFIVLIIALYLLADGERVYAWMIAFLSPEQRKRVATAAPEIEAVIFSYMGGQLVTSILCAVYIFVVLTFLHVPNALLLAVVGGIFDVLPVIGFFVAVIPAAAMALTVSPAVAGLVVGLYTLYHLVENYFIVPKVYGNRLRLSGLTVFVSCLAAGMVAGVVGIIVVLPIVACFPILERLWLRRVLGAETVEKHKRREEKDHPSG
jgi:predicted PurR-regulated permease PerM